MDYKQFIAGKLSKAVADGLTVKSVPDFLYPFQAYLVEWALHMGRCALFADCGLGKTPMQLAWANEVIKATNRPVLLLTPLAVGAQSMLESEKFGIAAERSRDGTITGTPRVVVTNYEQLHKFDSADFAGVVCDESSCIKDFKSQRKDTVTRFMRDVRFRLLCTATAAPNDYFELGTSSEALGLLGFRDMVTTFFKQETQKDFQGWGRTKYRFRGHAEHPFWSWVAGWARALRRPSDIGFDNDGFDLPSLTETEHVVDTQKPRQGMLFSAPAKNLNEHREERRNSIAERCQRAAELCEHDRPVAIWCELNAEGDQLERTIPDAVQVTGSMPDEQKEERLIAFSTGEIRRLVTKPKIGAWGLNWQHCSDIVSFPGYSYEQYYQLVRRCYRFGQQREVSVHLIVNEGQYGALNALSRKAAQAERMFDSVVEHMNDPSVLHSRDSFPLTEEIPAWL